MASATNQQLPAKMAVPHDAPSAPQHLGSLQPPTNAEDEFPSNGQVRCYRPRDDSDQSLLNVGPSKPTVDSQPDTNTQFLMPGDATSSQHMGWEKRRKSYCTEPAAPRLQHVTRHHTWSWGV
ncbi:hypothetical protein FALBO_12362 [Fusarium albosuccineum]|uniref:Uncharacterized protein n=1 Tax=Fusarium albosuccineum TaxID=1237068 RepID=A0A8H4L421_9HYPO|nr:hypothetical protein FALBO_12362 [Fusarium albosuccineum]